MALRRAPLVAGLAISLADPGGPFELTKETLAAMKVARTPPSQDELLVAVSKDLDAQVRAHGSRSRTSGSTGGPPASRSWRSWAR